MCISWGEGGGWSYCVCVIVELELFLPEKPILILHKMRITKMQRRPASLTLFVVRATKKSFGGARRFVHTVWLTAVRLSRGQHWRPVCHNVTYTDKKENQKFSSYVRKFRMEQLHSHIWLMATSYMRKYLRISSYIIGSPSSYMTLQLLHSEFPYIWGKFYFLFYQCRFTAMR